MLTAREAREKTIENANNYIEEEFLEIMKKIDEAVEEGYFSIIRDGYLQPRIHTKINRSWI